MDPESEATAKIAKDKSKELKVLQRKLSKVEERYIKKHNELSEISADREVLVNFVSLVFGEPYAKDLGTCNLEELETRYNTKSTEQRKTI
jgi:hypothetical protein